MPLLKLKAAESQSLLQISYRIRKHEKYVNMKT